MIRYHQSVRQKSLKREETDPRGQPVKAAFRTPNVKGENMNTSMCSTKYLHDHNPVLPQTPVSAGCSAVPKHPCLSILAGDSQIPRCPQPAGYRAVGGGTVLPTGGCKAVLLGMLPHRLPQQQLSCLPSSLGFGPWCCPSASCPPRGIRALVKPAQVFGDSLFVRDVAAGEPCASGLLG